MALPKLFKITINRYIDSNGKRCSKSTPGAITKAEKLPDWYADIKPTESAAERIERKKADLPAPKRKRVRLCSNKRAAQEMLRDIVNGGERKAAGLVDFQTQMHKPLDSILDDFQKHLKAKSNSAGYVRMTISRIETVCGGCDFLRLIDLKSDKAANWLCEQREQVAETVPNVKGTAKSYGDIGKAFGENARAIGFWRRQGAPIVPRQPNCLTAIRKWRIEYLASKSMSSATSNHYVTALRSFGRWLLKSKQVDCNPFENLEKVDCGDDDIRKDRRVLPVDEFGQLLQSAATSDKTIRGLNGTDRATIYTLAAYTGLRASEIGSLSIGSFDFRESTVTVQPAYTKNGKVAVIPMRSDLAERMRVYLQDRQPMTISIKGGSELVWAGNWTDEGAEIIRQDLKAAGIPYTNDDGKDFDFHALRCQFITGLAHADVSLQAAQKLARHSKPELTANLYTKFSLADKANEVEKMSAIPQVG